MMKTSAKIALYALVLGTALLLGGIAFQMVVGISLMSVTDTSAEVFGYTLMSRGSILLIVAYTLVFLSGIAFWRLGPYRLREDRWFRVAFLCFYIWVPVDIYTIVLDIRFAVRFDPHAPLTEELKALFMARQETLGPIPLLILLAYLVAIGMAIFRPQLGKRALER
ncbi:MAG TPA: hypothetical protein PKH77_28240 [Anaerolineae bacterium]|nr:hypothetical protein [Anaerolineae bacterium]